MHADSPDLLTPHYSYDDTRGHWVPCQGTEAFAYSDGEAVEAGLLRIVLAATDRSTISPELARNIVDWPTKYHLSPLRANLLRPLAPHLKGRILEIGAGCGAITRFLGESGAEVIALEGSPARARIAAARCAGLDNVQVVADALHRFPIQPTFDVVTLIGVLEYAPKYFPAQGVDPVDAMLRHASGYLKPGGVLVVAIENQLGLKYFAGSGEDHVGIPMFGLEDRYPGSGIATFGRAELRARIESAGLPHQTWWYPFPDYKLPTVVANHAALERTRCGLDHVIAPTFAKDPQAPVYALFQPDRVWRVLNQNRVAADLANSFLVVASRGPAVWSDKADAKVHHFATERKPEYAKALTFRIAASSGEVSIEQRRLFPDTPVHPGIPLKHRLDPEPAYLEGELWTQRLQHLITSDHWSMANLGEWSATWLQTLIAAGPFDVGPGQSDARARVPGALLDAVPRNMLRRNDGGCVFIDQEWQLEQPLELGYMLFRGVYLTLLHLGEVAVPAPGTPTRIFDLCNAIMAHLGQAAMQEADIAAYVARENDLQRWASDRPGMQLDIVMAATLRVHNPARLHDLLNDMPTLGDSVITPETPLAAVQNAPQHIDERGELAKLLATREAELAKYIALLAKRDDELKKLAVALQDQTQIGAELIHRSDLLQRHVDDLHTSLSWRITTPLRRLGDLALRAQYLWRSVAKAIELGGGPVGTVKLILKVARTEGARGLLWRFGNARRMTDKPNAGLGFLAPVPGAPALPAPPAPQFPDLPDYIVWGVIDWHFRHQRPQQLARAMSATGRRVFYISSNLRDAPQPGFVCEPLDASGRLFQINLHARLAPAIYTSTPDFETLMQLRRSIGEVLLWAKSRQVVSLVQHPYWTNIAAVLPNSKVVYDCMDHHEGFDNTAPELIALERDLFDAADLTITTSAWLDQRISPIARRHALIRNAGEYAHFATRPGQTYRDPKGRKIIGYYGAIAEWFDLDLVETIARHFPDVCVLLIGADTAGARERLGGVPNIEFTGEMAYLDLPRYLHGFDVCIMPFKVLPLTLATNPVKIYEFLSAGRPVVAIDLPEMSQFAGLISVAKDTDSFLAALQTALAKPSTAAEIDARQGFAREQTWLHRGQALIDAVERIQDDALVSVIVVTYNNLEFTKACLHSLAVYSDYPALEIIVVDNASSDGSVDYLKAWLADNPGHQVILNDDNRGFAAANNQGLLRAKGEYLVLLNNDAFVTPGWVATLINHLRRDPTIGLIGPVTNNIGNEAKINIAYASMADMLTTYTGYTHRHIGEELPLRTAAFFCVMMPRGTYETVGPLDEAFGVGFFEDDDYCRRIEQARLRIVCAEDVFVHHHLSASFDKLKDHQRKSLFERNKAIYEAKWGSWVPHSYR